MNKIHNALSCPLCGKSNHCGNMLGQPQGACWCSTAIFPKGLLALIPDDQVNKACICKECLEEYKL
jgi:hypothetical protein